KAAIGDEHEARGAVEAGALAFRARAHPAVAGELLAHHRRLGLAVAARQVRQDALELVAAARLAPGLRTVGELDRFRTAAVEQNVAHVLRQLGPGRLDVEAVVPG